MPTDTVIDQPSADDQHSQRPGRQAQVGVWDAFRGLPAWYRAMRWVVRRVVWRLRGLEYALLAVERELSSTVSVAWWRKPRLWRRGFLSESFVLYDLGRNAYGDYLSDLDRSVAVRRINRDYGVVLDDKLLFEQLMGHGSLPRPNLFGLLDGGMVAPFGDRRQAEELLSLLNREGALVLKPVRGGGGRGISVIRMQTGEKVLLNDRLIDADRLHKQVAGKGPLLVYECVRQHPTLSGIYPHSLNTIRLLTMTDEAGIPFPARAVLRLGTHASCPTDNWIRGGLCTAVDMSDGSLGRAVRFPAREGQLRWLTHHPDTGARIAGVGIPDWDTVTAVAVQAARTLPSAPYVGWDIALSEDGPVIIEGNSYSGVNLFQVHEPLLTSPEIRSFFERQGVVRRKNEKK